MEGQTPWTSHTRPWPLMGKNWHDQTWTYLMSYNLLRLFHVTPFKFVYKTHTYTQTSFQTRLPTNYVHTYILFSMHIMFLPHISGIPNYFIFPHSYLNSHLQIFSFPIHASIFTHTLMSFFVIGLTEISTTTLTHVSWYRPFLANTLYYTKKRHIITSRKTLSHNFSSFDSPSSVLSFYMYVDK